MRRTLSIAQTKLISCRKFVAVYWPNPGTDGLQIKSMFSRLADTEKKEEKEEKEDQDAAAPSEVNGETNGATTRRDSINEATGH